MTDAVDERTQATAGEGTTGVDDRTETIQRLWSDGAYEDVGALFEPISHEIVAGLDLAGRRVLDAATGTGNTALAAARAGARVDAFDLTPRLLEVARARARSEGLEIAFAPGDLVAVPYPDEAFDVVLSTFGAFTVDDPATCVRELLRVTRPGGEVVSAAWSSQGLFATLTDVVYEQHPHLRQEGGHLPSDWADEGWLIALVDDPGVEVAVEHRTAWFAFPSPAAAWELFERASGPVQRLRDAVGEEVAWRDVRAEVLRRWEAQARAVPDGVELPAVYGLARLRRAPAAPGAQVGAS